MAARDQLGGLAESAWPALTILAAAFDRPPQELQPPEWGVGPKMTKAMIDHGVFTRMRSEVVCLAPPLTTDEATLDELVAGVRNAVVDVFGE